MSRVIRKIEKEEKVQRLLKDKKKHPAMICDCCGCEVVFNLKMCRQFGMCGTCITGEAAYNYQEM